MTVQAQKILEDKIIELRATLTKEQWADSEYLLGRVESLEKTDIAFAYRLMQRVKNLAPTAEMNKKLHELKAKVQATSPEVLKQVSSKDSQIKVTENNIRKYINLILAKARYPRFKMLLSSFNLIVVFPFLVFSFYQIFIASDRFESRVMVIVKSPDSATTLDPAMALLSGLGSTASTGDNELLKSYIYSMDLLLFLNEKLDLKSHYSDESVDMISRLDIDASQEEFLDYFKRRVTIEIDSASGVLAISAQAFEPSYTQQLAAAIAAKAEMFINRIGNDLAKSQLQFVKNEHDITELRLQNAKSKVLEFQKRYDLLDPEAEGAALQRITYELEAKIATTKAQLRALKSGMSETAPKVLQIRAQLESLEQQLAFERSRLTKEIGSGRKDGDEAVGEILSQFSKLKIGLEFALQAYASSQVSLEKSRVEAYRQVKYLVVIESPVLPEDAKYPNVLYNLAIFLAAVLMIFGVSKIIIATVNELR